MPRLHVTALAALLTLMSTVDALPFFNRHKLIMFTRRECEEVDYMEDIVSRVEEATGKKVWKLDVESKQNSKLMRRLDDRSGDGEMDSWKHVKFEEDGDLIDDDTRCGGVPFFYNRDTHRTICGATDFENLMVWADNGDPLYEDDIPDYHRSRVPSYMKTPGFNMRIARWYARFRRRAQDNMEAQAAKSKAKLDTEVGKGSNWQKLVGK